MRKRNRPYNRTAPADASPDAAPSQVLYVLITIVCVAFLAVGFFFAARQHFLAIDLGIKNSDLRKQIDDLKGEQRRLVLDREIVRSPMEVKKIARQKGFDQVEVRLASMAANEPRRTPGLVTKTVMQAKTTPAAGDPRPVKAFFPVVSETSKVDRTRTAAAGTARRESARVSLPFAAKR